MDEVAVANREGNGRVRHGRFARNGSPKLNGGRSQPPREGLLGRLLSGAEEENRQAILASLPAGVGGSLLDLGTHEGVFTMRVARHVAADEVMGVELLADHAAVARAQGIDVRVADLSEAIPFDSASADFV